MLLFSQYVAHLILLQAFVVVILREFYFFTPCIISSYYKFNQQIPTIVI